MSKVIVFIILLVGIFGGVFWFTNSKVEASTPITGFGIMGDSGSDEYRADDNRGGTYGATTFNWAELLVRYRGVNMGPWGDWGNTRRSGYEYNWARSGARAQDLIVLDMHNGLANQVRAGLVSHVFLMIGGNDFAPWNGTYGEIYYGTLSPVELQNKINNIVANITTAVDAVLAAGNVSMVVCNIADKGVAPVTQAQFPDPAKRQLVTNAILATNQGIASMAAARNIPILDNYNFGNTLLSQVDQYGNYHIGGELISLIYNGDEPHHVLLGDNEHPGTVFSGLMANFILSPFNSIYNTGLLPFSDTEILQNAGIAVAPTTTPIPTQIPTDVPPPPTSTPTPTTVPVTPTDVPPTPTLIPPAPTMTPVPPTWTPVPTMTPTPTPIPQQTFNVAQYLVSRGTYLSGNTTSLNFDDNQYLVTKSTTSGFSRGITVDSSFQGVPFNISKMVINTRLKSNVSSTKVNVYLYNFTNDQWDQVSSFTISPSETLKSIIVSSNLYKYIGITNLAGVRISTNRSSTHNLSIDLLQLTVNQY